MAENKPVFPLWMVYPKSAAVFWTGIGVYTAAVDPQIRKKLPDTRSRLTWWGKSSSRTKCTVVPVALSAILVGLFAFKETENKFFLYGALAALITIPYSMIVMGPQERYLRSKVNFVADGGFLTKKDEVEIDSQIEQWANKHKIRVLCPVAAAALFAFAEKQQLTGKK